MLIGFLLISVILVIKYKPVYEVKTSTEILGYVENQVLFYNKIQEEILNIEGQNIESVALDEEPVFELKLISRNQNTNEDEIIEKFKKSAITTYKFYEVSLNGNDKEYVDTIEEAQKIVEEIKQEYDGNGLELDLTITEKYTQNKDEIKTDTFEVAELSFEEEIKTLIDEKKAKEAIATINGINIAVLPVSGRISSRFGDSSSIRSSTHTGLDIACSEGTDIKAVADGTVVFAEYNGSYGNLIKIDHGNDVATWYAHCSKIYVKVGDEVSSGDVIGAVGSTGNSTGPHLHLEIRINGVAVNPQKYVYNK